MIDKQKLSDAKKWEEGERDRLREAFERNDRIEDFVTDAPGEMRLVSADDYDKLQVEHDRLREALRHYADRDNWSKNGICLIGPAIATAALQEAGDE